jgi:hypothetical protein
MGPIHCVSGTTQISRVLAHARTENAKMKVAALVFIGDALEEPYDRPGALVDMAAGLGFPVFMFQEGGYPARLRGDPVTQAYTDIAQASGGAYARFEPGAAKTLAAMLKAVAAYASGGIAALQGRGDEASRLLLTQMKE